MNTSSTVWLNGQFIKADQFHLSPFHSALTVGEGIFETLRGIDSRVEALSLHLERLKHGADLFGFQTPDLSLVREVFVDLMEREQLGNAKLRLTLASDLLLLTAEPLPEFPESMAVVTFPHSRNENDVLTGVKSTSYGSNILAQKYAREHGAQEAIFGNTAGHLCEGSFTNTFVRIENQWFTPPLTAGPLPGITRRLVLEIADQIREENVQLADLELIEEMFLTSSLRGVMPVHSIDGRPLAFNSATQLIKKDLNGHIKLK